MNQGLARNNATMRQKQVVDASRSKALDEAI